MRSAEVVIIGGGIVGLSIGYSLARAGVRALILDRQAIGRGASWAGAGMIPPYTERLTTNPTLELRSWSALLYPEWSATLLEETGIDNGFHRTGGVDVAATDHEDDELRSMAGRWRNERVVYERLAPGDFGRVEPALNPDLQVAYWLPDRAQIRNPRHIQALRAALESRETPVIPHAEVTGFELAGDRVLAVATRDGAIACGTVVVAAGAWSAGLLEGLSLNVPTPPLKGQIVLLRSDQPLIQRIIEHGRMYLVPRDDGRILIGATEESVGFDDRTTAQAEADLLAEARFLCPILRGAEVERTWAGLRPGSIDSRPYLGRAPGWENVLVASGHQRAGIQLAPASAEVIADLILGRPARVGLDPFRIGREPSFTTDSAFRS